MPFKIFQIKSKYCSDIKKRETSISGQDGTQGITFTLLLFYTKKILYEKTVFKHWTIGSVKLWPLKEGIRMMWTLFLCQITTRKCSQDLEQGKGLYIELCGLPELTKCNSSPQRTRRLEFLGPSTKEEIATTRENPRDLQSFPQPHAGKRTAGKTTGRTIFATHTD